jgi:gliding motility-associated-like protein
VKKYLLFVIIVLASLTQEMSGQDIFPVPANYGFLCDEAQYLCGSDLDGYSGSLLQALSPLPQPFPICGNSGTAENTQWFSFIADDTIIQINITFDNCTFDISGPGVSAGLYMDCNLNMQLGDDLQIACNTVEGATGSIDLKPDSTIVIIPGNIYYLYVDGYNNAVCDFTINVISGVCIENIPVDVECQQDCGVANLLFDNLGCTGFDETYIFEPSSQILEDLTGCNPFIANALLDSIIYIDWEITPNIGFTVLSTPMYYDSLDIRASLEVTWNVPGTYTIKPLMSINPLYATCRAMCECTDDVVYTVTIGQSTLDTLPLIELCPTSTLTVDFCGQTYNSDTIVTCLDRDNCTITVQEISVLTRVDLPIDTHYICPNDCFEFNNMEFCTPNLFNFSLNGCDTFIQIQLVELDLSVNLTIAETLIDCINEDAMMTAEYPTNYPDSIHIFWLNEVGDTVSKAESYVATSGGTFTFHAVPLNATGCFQTISNTVTVDDQIPTVVLTPPSLDCNNATDIIQLTSTDNIASVSWTGPSGFLTADQSPTVTEGGIYTASITTTNGCNILEDTEVLADFAMPQFTIMPDDFDCSENIPVAQYSSSSTIVSVLWASGTETWTDQILNLQSSGNYTLTVTASNGCTATQSFTVIDNSYDPTLNLNLDFIWRCNDPERDIDITTLLDPALDYQWTNIDGGQASTTEILTINGPGVFILTGTDPSVGCVGHDTVRISEDMNLFIDIKFVVNNPTCFAESDGTIEITSYVGGLGPFTYLYEGSMFTDLASMQFSTGMHTISVFDQYDCEVSKTFEIISSVPFEVITEPKVTIKYGENGFLTADVNIDDSQLNTITWTDADGNFLAEGKEVEINADQEIIIVTAEDINGCTATATITLDIDYEVEIFYPNVFSPNGDGTNDNFMLYNSGSPENMNVIQIFDRAGELIFEEKNMLFNETQSGWNGDFNGQVVQPGVYVFIINYTLGNGESRMKSGSITVVR